jgi:competence ComEA-like helix-hairpin-helix protein
VDVVDTSGPTVGADLQVRPRLRSFILLVGAGLAALSWTAAAQSEPPLPDGPGKDVFESVCSLCHAPTAVVGKQWTRPQWEAKVREMLQEEPEVTTEERAAIVEYLSATFKPGGKIYINHAAAKDLESALEVATSEAEAIVRYRTEKGRFKTVDDLMQVPGLDAAKIDSKKDRLEF